MKAIRYDNAIVAFARAGEFILDPALAMRDANDPRRRWAAAVAQFACKVETGQVAGPYTLARACTYARTLLMPTSGFVAVASLPNGLLARHFAVPGEQVTTRRSELGLVWN